MNNRIEATILSNLFFNEDYTRKVLPFIKEDYFTNRTEKLLYGEIYKFVDKYKNNPTKDAILIELNQRKDINEEEHTAIRHMVVGLSEEEAEPQWLLDTTEKFCKDRAVHNAVLSGITILDGKDKKQTAEAIPHILSEALAVSFDKSVGHDYVEDADKRFEWYHTKEKKFQFDLNYFNKITKGGVPNKSLNICLAGTGVGKSLYMCHHAAACYSANKNVLYITCEMAEERIAERIDANLMDITLDSLKELPYEMYQKKLKNASAGITGKLIVKEYPTASAHSNHFRILLDELWLKKQFKPDIIFIDYLNICASSRIKQGSNANSYTMIKSIAEELRGLAVEYNVPVWSATQVNRQGFSSSDVGLEDTSESFGLPATADFMVALISTEDLDENNQVLVKQLKNRYNDTVANRKFLLGINRAKMKLYDVKEDEQSGLSQSNQTEEQTLGFGYNGKSFDDKFNRSPAKSKNFTEWKV